jgi:hypothetical protein
MMSIVLGYDGVGVNTTRHALLGPHMRQDVRLGGGCFDPRGSWETRERIWEWRPMEWSRIWSLFVGMMVRRLRDSIYSSDGEALPVTNVYAE